MSFTICELSCSTNLCALHLTSLHVRLVHHSNNNNNHCSNVVQGSSLLVITFLPKYPLLAGKGVATTSPELNVLNPTAHQGGGRIRVELGVQNLEGRGGGRGGGGGSEMDLSLALRLQAC